MESLLPRSPEPVPAFVIDRDPERRAALARTLRAAAFVVTEAVDVDAATPDPALRTPGVTALLAFGRGDRAEAERLRAAAPHCHLVAYAPLAPGGAHREILAAAQAAGCEGCLWYTTAAELVATLRACLPVGS